MPAAIAAHARAVVRSILAQAPAFAQLPPAERRELRGGMERIAVYLSKPEGLTARRPGAGDAPAVDFPDFVSGLLHGVFDAIINSSIEQMRAYAALIAKASQSVGEFTRTVDPPARPALTLRRRRDLLGQLEAAQRACFAGETPKRGTRQRARISPRA